MSDPMNDVYAYALRRAIRTLEHAIDWVFGTSKSWDEAEPDVDAVRVLETALASVKAGYDHE